MTFMQRFHKDGDLINFSTFHLHVIGVLDEEVVKVAAVEILDIGGEKIQVFAALAFFQKCGVP